MEYFLLWDMSKEQRKLRGRSKNSKMKSFKCKCSLSAQNEGIGEE